jgi:IS1 family transposase
MNIVRPERKLRILNLLVEGNSIRSTERLTRTHRDTIMRILVDAGEKCRTFLDQRMRDLHREHWEIDEIWTFCRKKEGRLTPAEKATGIWGDQYLFLAVGLETKVVPTFVLGKRTGDNARKFMKDLAARLRPGNPERHQLSTDGFSSYPDAVAEAFRHAADYGVIIKNYHPDLVGPGRYGPPDMTAATRRVVCGTFDPKDICTSHVGRNNLTIRTFIKRYTRLTVAFSKKKLNLEAAIALHVAHYNFCWVHSTLEQTPAQATGLVNGHWPWPLERLLEAAGVLDTGMYIRE